MASQKIIANIYKNNFKKIIGKITLANELFKKALDEDKLTIAETL